MEVRSRSSLNLRFGKTRNKIENFNSILQILHHSANGWILRLRNEAVFILVPRIHCVYL